MGAQESTLAATVQPLLDSLASSQRIGARDTFWSKLLKAPFKPRVSLYDASKLQPKYSAIIGKLLKNDTGNFSTLIRVLIYNGERLFVEVSKKNRGKQSRIELDECITSTSRALFLVNMCLQHMVQTLATTEFVWHIEQDAVTVSTLLGEDVDTERECDISETDHGVHDGLSQDLTNDVQLPTAGTVSSDITDQATVVEHAEPVVGTDGLLHPPAPSPPVAEAKKPILERFMELVARFLTLRVNSMAHNLVALSMNTMLVLSAGPAESQSMQCLQRVCLSPVVRGPALAGRIISAMLKMYRVAHPLARFVLGHAADGGVPEDTDAGFVSELMSVLSLPWQATTYALFGDEDTDASEDNGGRGRHLYVQSLHLLLLLINEEPETYTLYNGDNEGGINYVLEAFQSTVDADVHDAGFAPDEDTPDGTGFDQHQPSHRSPELCPRVSFSKLFDSLCTHAYEEESTLLLYSLVHLNQGFFQYMLSRIEDMGLLLLPLVENLYNIKDIDSRHAYIILSTLLTLSTDDDFCAQLQEVELDNTEFYTERILTNATIANTVFVVLTRLVLVNLKDPSDEYIHVTSLAVLANIAPHLSHLHPYIAERLINLCSVTSRQFLRVMDDDVAGTYAPGTPAFEFGRAAGMSLAIINACLINRLAVNPNLIHSLLVHKQEFVELRDKGCFPGELENIFIVVDHFERRLDLEGGSENVLSVETVLDIIENGAKKLPSNRLRKMPDAQFGYVEGDTYHAFLKSYLGSSFAPILHPNHYIEPS